jgi:pimeloyl-ACP methyl ester carboxylesterase
MEGAPHLRFAGARRAEAVVLLLHGGRIDGLTPVKAYDPGVLRMVPFGRSVARASGGRIALARLRYRVRGWNGDLESPLADARWALDRIAERFSHLPVGLVGHSMGGRVALRVADYGGVNGVDQGTIKGGGHSGGDRSRRDGSGGDGSGADRGGGVRSVAALAPWIPDGEPIPQLGDRALLLAHGTADRTTDPARTARLADELAASGAHVEMVKFTGGGHSMLFPARPWHDLVARFMVRTLLAPPTGGPAGSAPR